MGSLFVGNTRTAKPSHSTATMSESKSSTCASALGRKGRVIQRLVGCCRFFLFAVFALAIVLTL